MKRKLHLDNEQDCLGLAYESETQSLMADASALRDSYHHNLVTYSRNVFIPLTRLCRDVCHYCTFAQTPKRIRSPYLPVNEVLETVTRAKELGCKEALFTLGERPEARYHVAREALAAMGFKTTLDYLIHVADRVLQETGVLPHVNPGCMSRDEMHQLRQVSASMGLMLESVSERLCEVGMPHYGSPDKSPSRRLETIRLAGELSIPLTTGILIGIGETRLERIRSLLAIRRLHIKYGHIQEVIIQNFRAKPGTKMADFPEPDLNELLWTVAVARIILGAQMSIQVPPNLSSGALQQIIDAGIDDWGGVSPVTPDFVNPEAPWPDVEWLAEQTALSGKYLQERLTIYPRYIQQHDKWLDAALLPIILKSVDAEGYPRTDNWISGQSKQAPFDTVSDHEDNNYSGIAPDLQTIVATAKRKQALTEQEVVRLFQSRGPEVAFLCKVADKFREAAVGGSVTYVINRNINYTNICSFKCRFCAFSKGKITENLRGKPYDLSHGEIARRVKEARSRGATEVCLQGGIHPQYTGQTYIDILRVIKAAVPDIHIHAFSPLEVWQGARTLGISVKAFLTRLKSEGLNSLPGTAAEILDDEVRAIICPDKLATQQWIEVIETAHQIGLRTTATIMFGHVDSTHHWARHLLQIRQLQQRTGGFTELVPLPFVATEAPMYLRGKSRRGPTYRESLLMHAVSRIVLYGVIDNIQASWVKMGDEGVEACLLCGANDVGGTLMNETITRSAGGSHGQERTSVAFEHMILDRRRKLKQRNTDYSNAEFA